ncbi:hypothetical protein ACYSNR_14400 [Enterococcus sp. LJL128]|uniref:hypothetical protein n=1 Tax=Enterococcus sp. LJL51 TaxID=3416656 RepID=UPI003CF1876F
MLTPAYPNRGKYKDLLIELEKQLYKNPHYIYVKDRKFIHSQPLIEDSRHYYDLLQSSSNTVLFWSSKTRLHSPKLIYSIEKRTVVFETIISAERDDFSWTCSCLLTAAAGLLYGFKEDVEFVRMPKQFGIKLLKEPETAGEDIILTIN